MIITKTNFITITFILLIQVIYFSCVPDQHNEMDQYNVSWEQPSKIVSDGMPLGNGTSGVVVSVLEDGKIWISLRHVDAWSEAHRLLKLGDVEITVSPNPFQNHFRQELILKEGAIILEGDNNFYSKIWIDANNSVVHLENSSKEPFKLDLKLHTWRNSVRNINETNFKGVKGGIIESADVVVKNDKNAIIWYHQNSHNTAYEVAMNALEIPDLNKNMPNVLENQIFGAWIEGDKMMGKNKTELTSDLAEKNHLKIYTSVKQIDNSNKWLNGFDNEIHKKRNINSDWAAHVAWWKNFWSKSFIHITGTQEARTASAGYAYVMYLNAMAGRGEFPIMWNGSIYSPPTGEVPVTNHTGTKSNKDPDFRPWGNLMLHQNVRLPYYSMYASGQFEMVKPFLDVYMRGFPLMKDHTKAVFGHVGTVIRESTTLWGVVAPGVYGIDREGLESGQQESVWHRTHWQSGLEVANFMADYYQYTLNPTFAKDTLIPFAGEVVQFFDYHWPHRGGKLYFPNVFAMETFRDTDNPMPLVAGMKAVLSNLLALPDTLTNEKDRKYWRELLAKVPEIPTRERNGKTILSNAEKIYSQKVNAEVSELYAVFPYHLYGVGLPDLEIAQETYKNRTILVDDIGGKNPGWAQGFLRGGWRQEVVMAAMVGLTDSAKKEVSWALHRPVPELRFPGFFQTTYDGVPDVQHASMAATGLQKMLLQNVGNKIILMPAWPDDWSCTFRLYAKNKTIVEGTVENGKLVNILVTPSSREKDVFIGPSLQPAFN